jgi:hypothetical protein
VAVDEDDLSALLTHLVPHSCRVEVGSRKCVLALAVVSDPLIHCVLAHNPRAKLPLYISVSGTAPVTTEGAGCGRTG